MKLLFFFSTCLLYFYKGVIGVEKRGFWGIKWKKNSRRTIPHHDPLQYECNFYLVFNRVSTWNALQLSVCADLTSHHKLSPWIWPNAQPKQTTGLQHCATHGLLTDIWQKKAVGICQQYYAPRIHNKKKHELNVPIHDSVEGFHVSL